MADETFTLYVTEAVKQKLRGKHDVEITEVEEAFNSTEGPFLIDRRREHRTHPPTRWFIGETKSERILKVVFMRDVERRRIILKTAYDPSNDEIFLYEEHS